MPTDRDDPGQKKTGASTEHRDPGTEMASAGTRKTQLIALLAGGHTYEECASTVHISKRTIVRLNADLAFVAEVRRARSILFERTVGLLAAEAGATIRTLVELRDGGGEAARLGACRTLLDKLASTREQLDLEARLNALEEGLARRQVGGVAERED